MNKLVLISLIVGPLRAAAATNDFALTEALEKAGLQGAQVMGQIHVGADGFSCKKQGETYRCSGTDMGSDKKVEITGSRAETIFKALQAAGAKPVDGAILAPNLVCKRLKDETGETVADRTTCSGVDDPGPAVDPDKMCEDALKKTCEPMRSLKCVTEILQSSGVTQQRVMAVSAKDSAPAFEKAGFTDMLADAPKLLDDPTMIPKGAVIILAKKSGGCPVSVNYGSVAIKCGTNDLAWPHNKAVKSRSLTDFVKQNRACVKAVLTHARVRSRVAPSLPVPAVGNPAKK